MVESSDPEELILELDIVLSVAGMSWPVEYAFTMEEFDASDVVSFAADMNMMKKEVEELRHMVKMLMKRHSGILQGFFGAKTFRRMKRESRHWMDWVGSWVARVIRFVWKFFHGPSTRIGATTASIHG